MSIKVDDVFKSLNSLMQVILPVAILGAVVPALQPPARASMQSVRVGRSSVAKYLQEVIAQYRQSISVEDVETIARAIDIVIRKGEEALQAGSAKLSEEELNTIRKSLSSIDKVTAFLVALKSKLEFPEVRTVRTRLDTLMIRFARRLAKLVDSSASALQTLKTIIADLVADKQITREEALSAIRKLVAGVVVPVLSRLGTYIDIVLEIPV